MRRYKLDCANVRGMEGGGFGFPFGGDPEDLLRGLQEFAEQQAESVQEAQREQFATLTLNTAVELTSAALSQIDVQGSADEQATAVREAMRVLFPEAVALVSAARQGFMRGQAYARPERSPPSSQSATPGHRALGQPPVPGTGVRTRVPDTVCAEARDTPFGRWRRVRPACMVGG